MISVYLNLFNINLTAWFSAMILDGHAAKLATLSMMLPPTTLLGLIYRTMNETLLRSSLIPTMRVPMAEGAS